MATFPIRQQSFLLSIVCLVLILPACGSKGGGGSGPSTTTSAAIGAAGGSLTSSDGKLTLTIPADALGNSETITIESIDPSELSAEFSRVNADRAFRFGPSPLSFQKPVQVSMKLDDPPVQADGSVHGSLVALVTSSNGVLESLGNVVLSVDMTGNTATATGELPHFSEVAVAVFEFVDLSATFDDRNPEFTYRAGEKFDIVVSAKARPRVGIKANVNYLDQSRLPVLSFEPPKQFDNDLNPIPTPLGLGHFTGSANEQVNDTYEYGCESVAQTARGLYQGHFFFRDLQVLFVDDPGRQAKFDALKDLFTGEVLLEQEVTCLGSGTSTTIGPEGGVVMTPDGRIRLDIPAGALDTTQTISIHPIDPPSLGTEFGGMQVTRAYALQPDGLEFLLPVTASMVSDEPAIQADGSLSAALAFPITSSGGASMTALPNAAVYVDGDANTVKVIGALLHFSEIWSVTGNAVRVTASGIPVTYPRYAPPFDVTVTAAAVSSDLLNAAVFYTDVSELPVELASAPPVLGNITNAASGRIVSGTVRMQCGGVGLGVYVSRVTLESALWLTTPPTGSVLAEYPWRFSKSVRCTEGEPPLGPLVHTTRQYPEGLFALSDFIEQHAVLGVFDALGITDPDREYVVVANGSGFSVIDIATGEELTGYSGLATRMYGAVPLVYQDEPCFFLYGISAWYACYTGDTTDPWTLIAGPPGGYSDAGLRNTTPVAGLYGLQHLLWWVAGLVNFEEQPGGSGTPVYPNYLAYPQWYNVGGPPSGVAASAYFYNPTLVVTAGEPGQLWWGDPSVFQGGTLVGSLGNDPRKLRCAVPICAVSNFASDTLSVILWNGSTTPTIQGSVVVGDGPVGIDITRVDVNYAVVSTGYHDNTYTITSLGPDGSELSTTTLAVPTGCTNPGHAIFVQDGAATKVVISCNGSASIAVIPVS